MLFRLRKDDIISLKLNAINLKNIVETKVCGFFHAPITIY